MTSKAGYWLAPIPFVLGIVIAVWAGWSAATAVGNAFTRFVVPGSGVVALEKPGTYTIFHETRSVIGGRMYAVKDMPSVKVDVAPEGGGAAIPVEAPGGHSTYSFGGHVGESLMQFTIVQPGRYRVTATYSNGQNGPQTVLAVSSGVIGTIFRAIGIVIGSLVLGFALSLALLLTTYFRRRRMVRAAPIATGAAPNWHSTRTPS
jgi:hypothetical protein